MLELCEQGVVAGAAVRTACRACCVILVLGWALFAPAPLARTPADAQEPNRGPAAASPADPGGTSIRFGGADETEASATSEPDPQSGSPRLDARESFLMWMIRASGPIGLVIAVMSFYLIALVVWMALHYRTTAVVPRELVHDVRGLLEQTKYQEAYHRLLDDSSFLARVLAAGVRKLPGGLSPAQRAMELANEDVTMEMEHRTTYLATVGTLGPMIGLVGTVYGMIMAFRVIAQEGSTPQASQLAAGISTALFATLEGIALSIPAIYFYALFRNRIARLSLEVGMTAEPLLEQFAPGVRIVVPPGTSPNTSTGPAPSAHAHPFAVSAALAAAAANAPRPALPPAEPAPIAD
jgi:biopolymer transport protein ExbB